MALDSFHEAGLGEGEKTHRSKAEHRLQANEEGFRILGLGFRV